MVRKISSAIIGSLFVISALVALGLITLVPDSPLISTMVSITAFLLLLTAALVLRSFQQFFSERREASQRLLGEVRTHRAETKLLKSEIETRFEDTSATIKALYDATPSYVTKILQQLEQSAPRESEARTALRVELDIGKLRQEVREAIKTARGDNRAKPAYTSKDLETIHSVLAALLERNNEDFTSRAHTLEQSLAQIQKTTETTTRDLQKKVMQLQKSTETATSDLKQAVLNNGQSNNSDINELNERIAVKSKQILSVLESQRINLRTLQNGSESRDKGITDTVTSARSDLAQNLQKMLWNSINDQEGVIQLFTRFTLRAMMPPSGRWAMDPRSLMHLLDIISRARPQHILELGSGTSTVWLGYEAERINARVVSIDHLDEFADRTRAYLNRHQLDSVATVHSVPTKTVEHEGKNFEWYDLSAVDIPAKIDILLVDGPPGSFGPFSRYPALPQLLERLDDQAIIILDDAKRPDENQIVEDWLLLLPNYARVDDGMTRLGILAPKSGKDLSSIKD